MPEKDNDEAPTVTAVFVASYIGGTYTRFVNSERGSLLFTKGFTIPHREWVKLGKPNRLAVGLVALADPVVV